MNVPFTIHVHNLGFGSIHLQMVLLTKLQKCIYYILQLLWPVGKQDHIISKQKSKKLQRCKFEKRGRKSCLAALHIHTTTIFDKVNNPVKKQCKQFWWGPITLLEPFIGSEACSGLISASCYYPQRFIVHILEHSYEILVNAQFLGQDLPQLNTVDWVICLFNVHKTHGQGGFGPHCMLQQRLQDEHLVIWAVVSTKSSLCFSVPPLFISLQL